MAVMANVLNAIGIVFLSHAVYSAYEHSLLTNGSSPPSARSSFLPQSLDPKINVPADIVVETLVSVLMLCFGVVLGAPELKPIQWNVWAGSLERSQKAREITEVGVGGGNPYAVLEERPGFLNVRSTRKAFSSWMKDQEKQS